MSIDLHGMALVAVVAAVTMLIRFSAVSGVWRRAAHAPVHHLPGRVLPCAIMAMLGWSTACGAWTYSAPTHGLPELIAAAAVVGLHCWKKNTLLSIAAGTALYMVLVQVVFV